MNPVNRDKFYENIVLNIFYSYILLISKTLTKFN